MPKLQFHMGVTLRCYGNVEIEADSVEAALPLLTADYIGENITITETTTDSGQDLAVIDVSDAETGEELEQWAGLQLPSPYDPPPPFLPDHACDTVDALTQAESFISGFEDDEEQQGVADVLAGLRAAIPREQAKPEILAALKVASDALAGTLKARGYVPGSSIEQWAPEVQTELRSLVTVRAAIAKAEGRAK